MSDFPSCPNCHREQKLLGESSTHWAFRCPCCSFSRIISKPTCRGASRLEVALQRRQQLERFERWKDSRPAYSLPPPRKEAS